MREEAADADHRVCRRRAQLQSAGEHFRRFLAARRLRRRRDGEGNGSSSGRAQAAAAAAAAEAGEGRYDDDDWWARRSSGGGGAPTTIGAPRPSLRRRRRRGGGLARGGGGGGGSDMCARSPGCSAQCPASEMEDDEELVRGLLAGWYQICAPATAVSEEPQTDDGGVGGEEAGGGGEDDGLGRGRRGHTAGGSDVGCHFLHRPFTQRNSSLSVCELRAVGLRLERLRGGGGGGGPADHQRAEHRERHRDHQLDGGGGSAAGRRAGPMEPPPPPPSSPNSPNPPSSPSGRLELMRGYTSPARALVLGAGALAMAGCVPSAQAGHAWLAPPPPPAAQQPRTIATTQVHSTDGAAAAAVARGGGGGGEMAGGEGRRYATGRNRAADDDWVSLWARRFVGPQAGLLGAAELLPPPMPSQPTADVGGGGGDDDGDASRRQLRCDGWVNHTVVVVSRDNNLNTFHSAEDWIMLYVAYVVLDLDPAEVCVAPRTCCRLWGGRVVLVMWRL
jgi:hypothetical protein